ncbi:MAG: PAS domain S-box protein [Methanoregula sp.]|nr:PAS domain S-box protein [Methanoregula sp.]
MPPTGQIPDHLPRGIAIILVVLILAIIAAGALFYQSQERQIKDSVTTELSSIALLKTEQIAAWRGERLGDAAVLSQNRILIGGLKEYLATPDPSVRQKILSLFGQINISYDYRNVMLVDREGRVQLSLDPADTTITPWLDAQLAESFATRTALLTDLSPGTDRQSPRMYAIAPLVETTNGNTDITGAVILTIDPADDLYPLVQLWPVPSVSAETLLVEREGDHVLFLNELRHQNNTALNLTIPLTQKDLPAVMAVTGTTGAFEGTDYRGAEVISVLEPVPGSPWFMIAKIDTAEAYSAWRSRSVLIIVLVAGTLAGGLIILVLVWQRRQNYYYRSLYAAEAERGREEKRNRERLETLLYLVEMESASDQELAEYVLDAGCRLTDSTLAFIGVMSPDESVFDITAWSKQVMQDCSVAASPIHFPIAKAGIWAEAVRQRKPQVVNDYPAPRPGKKGLPPGHIPITRFASIPIFEGQRIVMVCAVANKATDYTGMDVDDLTLLMQGVWSHLRKRKADEALRLKTADLEAAYEEITATDEELRANYEDLAESRQALAESERKYRDLYTYAQVGLFETSFKDATVVTCNERYASLAGFPSAKEATGSDVLHLYANPDDRTEVGRILRKDGHIRDYILKLRNHATGKIFWAQFSARFNYEREVAEGSIVDITAQKEAEAALRASEDAFRSLAENANDGFLVGAASGMHVFANKRAEEITGYSIDELVHSSIRQIVRPDEFERVIQGRFKKHMAGEPAPNQYETVLVGKDGRDIPIELSSSKIEWYGEPADLIVFRDITERKRSMDTLRESERQLREAQEMAHLGFWTWDITTGDVEWSEEVFRIFGLDPATFTPQIDSILALSPWPEDHERNRELIRRAMESREPGTYEQRFLRPDKSTGYYHSTFQGQYDESGNLVTIVGTVLDITERRQAEEALRESESRFRTLVEQLPLGIAMTKRSKEGEAVFYFNQSFTTITGYTLEMTSSFDAWALRAYPDPEYRRGIFNLAAEMYGEAGRDITSRPRVTRVTCSNGTVKEIEFRYTDLRVFGFWTLNDITERIAAEEESRSANAFLDMVIEMSPFAMWISDKAGTVTRVNRALSQTIHLNPDDIIGKYNVLMDTNLEIQGVLPSVKAVFDTHTPARFSIPWKAADAGDVDFKGGCDMFIDVSLFPILNARGELTNVVCQWVDVTERKKIEDALRESEEKFRALFTSMIEGSALHEIIFDPSGAPSDYRILDVNPAYESIIGLRLEDVRGKTSREVYQIDTPPFLETYARVAATGQPEVFEVFFAPMEKHFSISVFSPQQGKFATIFEDITGRKRAEQQRETLIRELEQKNAELERFTFTVSHDLKSPLITIKGFAGLLEDDVRSGDQVQLKKDINRITSAANTMQELLADVLELARIGRVAGPREKIPFGAIAREAVDLLAGPLAERGVWVDIAPDLPVVSVDHARVREALINLIENAIKFLGSQQNPVIRIGVEREEATPVFFVQDNGIGIDPRYLERIFNLFERLDVSTPGTGIGLPIVRRIIETHGGNIWAESEGVGKGTTLKFTLPAADQNPGTCS